VKVYSLIQIQTTTAPMSPNLGLRMFSSYGYGGTKGLGYSDIVTN